MNASLKILPSVGAGTNCQDTAWGSLSDHLGAIGHPEINVVEYVEEFSAELHGGLFRHPRVFEEAEVRIEELRSPQNILSGVPKRSEGLRWFELRGIEPLLNHRSV